MSLAKDKSFRKKLREMENAFKYRRIPYPKRYVELIAVLAISCTFILFMHTNKLNSRLKEMEGKLQPSEFSATGITDNNHISGSDAAKHLDVNSLHGTYEYLKSTSQIEKLTPDTLNNTAKAQMDIVFFNRVAKVGSQAMMSLITILAKQNQFQATLDKAAFSGTMMLAPRLKENLVEKISELKKPSIFVKHVAYIDFESISYPRPIYINLVRDPIERLISWFYYIRAPWYIAERKRLYPTKYQLPAVDWLNKSFDTCILEHDPDCIFKPNDTSGLGVYRRQMWFFCGQNSELCTPFNSYEAMQIAKRNVEKHYAVVGSWEETTITLSVLEHYIPHFFKGATKLYYQKENKLNSVNRNPLRPTISQKARAMLSQNLTNEIEFYKFCKQRLYKQYIARRTYTAHNTPTAHAKEKELNDLEYYDEDDDDGNDMRAAPLNNTRKAEIDMVFFNRVPKVGSQALMVLIENLAKINGFEDKRDAGNTTETVLIQPPRQKKLIADLLTKQLPFIYTQHIAYVNFTRFNMPKPIYINLVRDPIERIISWHYYIRAPWYYADIKKRWGENSVQVPPKEFMEMDLDTCVRIKDVHCVFENMDISQKSGDHRRQTLFFCGQNRQLCMAFNSKAAMQQAKRTVEEDYAVVGSWEDKNITLTVLERYIPRYFKSAKMTYFLDERKFSTVNKNPLKPKKAISDETREILKKNFTHEIEFYEFCKQRLYMQYAAINDGNQIDSDDYVIIPEHDDYGGD